MGRLEKSALSVLNAIMKLFAIVIGGMAISLILAVLPWREVLPVETQEMPAQETPTIEQPQSTAILKDPAVPETLLTEAELQAQESTEALPPTQRSLLQALSAACASGDDMKIRQAIEDWSGAEWNSWGTSDAETPWLRLDGLTWDGERFITKYTGIGITFSGRSIYYGEIKQGVPNGTGVCYTVDTRFPQDNSAQFFSAAGNWQEGTMIGEATLSYLNTSPEKSGGFEDVVCVGIVDGSEEEIITTGNIEVRTEDGHVFHFSILNQMLTETGEIRCSVHNSCDLRLYLRKEDINQKYQNLFPWGKDRRNDCAPFLFGYTSG